MSKKEHEEASAHPGTGNGDDNTFPDSLEAAARALADAGSDGSASEAPGALGEPGVGNGGDPNEFP